MYMACQVVMPKTAWMMTTMMVILPLPLAAVEDTLHRCGEVAARHYRRGPLRRGPLFRLLRRLSAAAVATAAPAK